MARHPVTGDAVKGIVESLVALFLREGSVNSIHRLLSDALAQDHTEGRIYPNRLHGLLSADPSRSVNTQTLELMELAISRLGDVDVSASGNDLRSLIYAQSALLPRAGAQAAFERISTLANRLGLPRAVVASVLAERGDTEVPTGASTSDRAMAVSSPDWSFQDDACADCITSLRQGPDRKVGLVLPTGGGKTRVAMRIALDMLVASDRSDSKVLWVTHRAHLHTQARRELQRVQSDDSSDLPDDALALLGSRVVITMVSGLADKMAELGDTLELVIVDEAHHAAASSYLPIFERKPLRALFLTATPNRTDKLPIGIDEIAYTVTYRELFRRGVLIEPVFEGPLTIDQLDWENPAHVRDLADYILDRAESDFEKTLVVASRIDYVERLHEVLTDLLSSGGHRRLTEEDVFYVHGRGTSTGATPLELLDETTAVPRGILVSTAQMLGEGFDDPAIDSVVITYESTSMIQLMQAAGRCLRFAPGKRRAWVVQVRDSDIGYHYEQRWLYQDISDHLRPQLVDVNYTDLPGLSENVDRVLAQYNVEASVCEAVRASVSEVEAGESFSLLLSGLWYDRKSVRFHRDASWNAVPVAESERQEFMRVFNDFSARNADVTNDQDFLRLYLRPDPEPGSRWKLYLDMLHAMRYAGKELRGESYATRSSRDFQPNRGTSWLTYVEFRHAPAVSKEFEDFLADTLNREELVSEYLANRATFASAVKLRHPLHGAFGFLLDESADDWLCEKRQDLLARLVRVGAREAFIELACWRQGVDSSAIPQILLERIEALLSEAAFADNRFDLTF